MLEIIDTVKKAYWMTYFIATFINALAAYAASWCWLIILKWIQIFFALFNSIVALWSFIYFLSMIHQLELGKPFFIRTLNTIALFIPPAFLFFCLQITSTINTNLKDYFFYFSAIDILCFANLCLHEFYFRQ